MLTLKHWVKFRSFTEKLRVHHRLEPRAACGDNPYLIPSNRRRPALGGIDEAYMNIRPFRSIYPQLGERVYVDPSAVVIGRVRLAEDVSVWPCVVIRGDVNDISIGARSNIQDGSVLHVTRPSLEQPAGIPLLIGADVTVGHGVTLHACTIGNFCLIGMGAMVLDGAVLDDYVFVGAGAVVTPGKKLESRGLYLGNPARRVRDLTDKELADLRASAKHYATLKDEYL